MLLHLEELERTLAKFNINKNDICIIGSSTLAVNNLRNNHDIDFCIKKNILASKFPEIKKSHKISENLELIVSEKYLHFFGLSDNEIINNEKYHTTYEGFKILRLEIEFASKLIMMREKDIFDINIILNHIKNAPDWDWLLVLDKKPNKQKIESNKTKILINKIFSKISSPLAIPKKILRKTINKIKWPLNKMKGKIEEVENKINFSKSIIDDSLIIYPTNKLLAKQYSEENFNRIDIIVRYLAIENFFNKNKNGFLIYDKMQNTRGNYPDAELKFRNLILSIEKNGFDNNNPIPIDSYGNIEDGAHRLASALYFGIENVPVKIRSTKFKTNYRLSWFKKNDFSEEHLNLISSKKDEIFMKNGIYFPIILWPPAFNFFDEITHRISSEYKVITAQSLSMNDSEFKEFSKKMYSIDDIAEWKIERKIAFMQPYEKKIKAIIIEIPNPDFRKKATTGNDISKTMEALKTKYRAMYKDKIDEYIYDIILHTGDNYEHNKKIMELIKLKHD